MHKVSSCPNEACIKIGVALVNRKQVVSKGDFCPFETSMKIANACGKLLPCDLKQAGKKPLLPGLKQTL